MQAWQHMAFLTSSCGDPQADVSLCTTKCQNAVRLKTSVAKTSEKGYANFSAGLVRKPCASADFLCRAAYSTLMYPVQQPGRTTGSSRVRIAIGLVMPKARSPVSCLKSRWGM